MKGNDGAKKRVQMETRRYENKGKGTREGRERKNGKRECACDEML